MFQWNMTQNTKIYWLRLKIPSFNWRSFCIGLMAAASLYIPTYLLSMAERQVALWLLRNINNSAMPVTMFFTLKHFHSKQHNLNKDFHYTIELLGLLNGKKAAYEMSSTFLILHMNIHSSPQVGYHLLHSNTSIVIYKYKRMSDGTR